MYNANVAVHTLRDRDDGDKSWRSLDVETEPENTRVLLTFRNLHRDTVDVIIVEKKELQEALLSLKAPGLTEI